MCCSTTTGAAVNLRELRLHRLPGLEEPFTITGRPGLNLILGPNGSGKSSLCRAVLGLLWPNETNVGHLVEATWDLDGTDWHSERTGGPTVHWHKDGESSPPPPLPPVRDVGVYRLGILDLLKPVADTTDQALAAEIRRQLAGGIDLRTVRSAFSRSGREGQSQAQTLGDFRERVRMLQAQQRELIDEESRLEDLESRHAGAVEAASRHQALKTGRDLAAAIRELQTATERLAVFPTVMSLLHGDEDEQLAALLARRDDARSEIADATEAERTATEDLAAADLADGGPDDVVLEAVRNLLERAREDAADLRQAEGDLAAASAARDTTGAQLAPLELPAPGEPVSADAVTAAVNRLRERDLLRARRDGLNRLLNRPDLAREQSSAGEPVVLASARAALAAWLAGTAPTVPWFLRALPWLAAGGLILVGGVLQPWRDGSWPGWLAIALGALLVPAKLVLRHRTQHGLARQQAAARAAFVATERDEPEAWTREKVGPMLRGLLAEEAAAGQARLREQLRCDLQAGHDQASEQLGDDDADTELDQTMLLQRVAAYHEAVAAHDAASACRDTLMASLASKTEDIREQLAPWRAVGGSDVPTLTAAVSDLSRRRDRWLDATARLGTARQQLSGAGERRDTAAGEIAGLLARLVIPDEDHAAAAIDDLLARREAYQQASQVVDQCQAECNVRRNARNELSAELVTAATEAVDLPAAELDAAIDEVAATAAQAGQLGEKITEIRTRVGDARGKALLTETRAEEEAAAKVLATVRDGVRTNALASLLLERAAASYESATEPPLLCRTQDLFHRFTDGRFELKVAAAENESAAAAFRAIDATNGHVLSLGQLSDGTRAQLLLAARLAALPEHERGVRPPLFLDESLTASDAVRFDAVGTALLELMRSEGRQIFYLTCDPADAAAWQRLLAASGHEPAPQTDLATVRRLAARAAPERLRPEAPITVPPLPDSGDAAAYGESLEVPPLSVGQHPDSVHLFHLLRGDLGLLHRLLRRRITNHAALVALTDDLLADRAIDATEVTHIQALHRGLTAFLDAFASGRGRPIPAGALAHESGIKSTLLTEIENLSVTLRGDAAALMDALDEQAVKGLRVNIKERLEDWLETSGYLDRRPQLDREEVRRRTLRALRPDLAGGIVELEAVDLLIDAWWVASPSSSSPSGPRGAQPGSGG